MSPGNFHSFLLALALTAMSKSHCFHVTGFVFLLGLSVCGGAGRFYGNGVGG